MAMQNTKPFAIFNSSAGSGKTYTLAREYLKLALSQEHYFEHILAVTFTNKATSEMKNRILEYLIAFGEGDFSTMGREICSSMSITEEELQSKSKTLLTQILHHYSLFSVTTIDSFFQKVIKSFARETGIHSGMRLELDTQKAKFEIVEALMAMVGKNKVVTDWVLRFADQHMSQQKNWDIRKKIREFSGELFKESFKVNRARLSVAGKPETIVQLAESFKSILEHFESEMLTKANIILKKAKENGFVVDDFSYKKSGVLGMIETMSFKREFEVKKKRILECVGENPSFAAKSSPEYEKIQAFGVTEISPLLKEMIATEETYGKAYRTAKAAKQNLYLLGLMGVLDEKLNEYKEENNLFLISDSGEFLNQIMDGNDAPFIYEKTGNWYWHYLIDEFQDTSKLQWANFKPLIENSLSNGNFNMVVGDVKQSIYRWRGGDWSLLLGAIEEEIGAFLVTRHELSMNYRSEAKVVYFNNLFFLEAIEYAMENLLTLEASTEPSLPELRKKIGLAYDQVAQDIPEPVAEKDQGWVNLEGIEVQEEEKFQNEVLTRIPEFMEKMQDAGYGPEDIAFLVRRSSEGRDLANFMMNFKDSNLAKPGYSYDVISDESLFIASSRPVAFVISYLKWILNPFDNIAFTVVKQFVEDHKEDLEHAKLYMKNNAELVFESIPDNYFQLPLSELIEEIIRVFKLDSELQNVAYVQRFQDVVFEFISDYPSDISGFLEWWEEQSHRFVIKLGEGLQASRILTIHKSKGLQFKIVVIPFANWGVETKSGSEILWATTDAFGFEGVVPVTYSSKLKDTYFEGIYLQEKFLKYKDHINMLYVAFTRAEHGLKVFYDATKKTGDISKWIKAICDNPKFRLSEYWHTEEKQFNWGELTFQKNKNNIASPHFMQPLKSVPWKSRVRIKKNFDQVFEVEKSEKEAKVNYGKLVHDVLASIEYAEDIAYARDKFLKSGMEKEAVLRKQVIQKVEQLIQQPDIAPWFSKPWKVKNEATILNRQGIQYRPDRVIIKDKNEAVVIDYKTGKPEEEHKKQVLHYGELLEELGYTNVRAYLLYLESMSLQKVEA